MQRISELFAPLRRALASKEVNSIASFQTSCVRVVTSPRAMELVARAFMERSSRMRTLPWSTKEQVCWHVLDDRTACNNSLDVPVSFCGNLYIVLLQGKVLFLWLSQSQTWRKEEGDANNLCYNAAFLNSD